LDRNGDRILESNRARIERESSSNRICDRRFRYLVIIVELKN
jgi:hypothetical protein